MGKKQKKEKKKHKKIKCFSQKLLITVFSFPIDTVDLMQIWIVLKDGWDGWVVCKHDIWLLVTYDNFFIHRSSVLLIHCLNWLRQMHNCFYWSVESLQFASKSIRGTFAWKHPNFTMENEFTVCIYGLHDYCYWTSNQFSEWTILWSLCQTSGQMLKCCRPSHRNIMKMNLTMKPQRFMRNNIDNKIMLLCSAIKSTVRLLFRN